MKEYKNFLSSLYLRLCPGGKAARTVPNPQHSGQVALVLPSSESASHSSMRIMLPRLSSGSQPLPSQRGQSSTLKTASSNSLSEGITLFSGHIVLLLTYGVYSHPCQPAQHGGSEQAVPLSAEQRGAEGYGCKCGADNGHNRMNYDKCFHFARLFRKSSVFTTLSLLSDLILPKVRNALARLAICNSLSFNYIAYYSCDF